MRFILDLQKSRYSRIFKIKILPYNEPYPEYLDTLRKGIRKNWPDMDDEEIKKYLKDCIRG